jgi:membrane protease YdiL (CAAX protease family)
LSALATIIGASGCPCGSEAVTIALMVIGAVATGIGWYLVSHRGASIWVVFATLNGILAVTALLTRRLALSPSVGAGVAVAAGLGAGLLLYAGTYVFVVIARRWPSFSKDVSSLYGRGAGMSLPIGLLLGAAIAAPGEEIFWRGLFQQHLAQSWGRGAATVVTVLAYVAANAVSLSLPIAAAALVGGAIWGLLAAWSGGVLASVVCHAVWTGMMVAFPPPGGARPAASESERGAAA